MRTDTMDRLAVTWRTGAEPGPAGRARLAALARRLGGAGFDTGADAEGGQVCIRHLRLPRHRMRWDTDDGAVADSWEELLRRAVSAAVAAGGPDVVRFAGPDRARTDLVVGVLRGDRGRAWAWRLAGVWPREVGDPAGAADVLQPVLVDAGREAPETVVGLLVTVAAAGLLPALVAATGPALLVELVRAAWVAAGGAGEVMRPAGATDARSGPVPRGVDGTCALVRGRSVILRAAAGVAAARPATTPGAVGVPPGSGTRPGAAPRAHDARAGTIPVAPVPSTGAGPVAAPPGLDARPDDAGTGPLPAPPAAEPSPSPRADPARIAEALAVAAVLEVEPVLATGPAGPAVAARLAATVHAAVHADATPATPPDAAPPAVPSGPGPVPAPASHATAWGGLLFLLPVVAGIGLPQRVAADPERFGPGLRPVLSALARLLADAAVPGAGPPDPADPAVLAFAGLAPGTEPPPQPAPGAGPLPATLAAERDAIVAALRVRLRRPEVPPSALLTAVCRRRAVIEADPGWIDVLLELDEVDVDVRRAGLDLDPGHLPWLGCVVRFRYG